MLLEQTMQQPFPRGGCFPLADPRFMASVSAGAFSLWSCIFLLYPFKVLIHFVNKYILRCFVQKTVHIFVNVAIISVLSKIGGLFIYQKFLSALDFYLQYIGISSIM